MPVLSRKWKFLYLLNPRTGSTMLEHVLMAELGGERFPPADTHDEKMRTKHLTLREIRRQRLLSKKELEELLTVSSVRHPYEKAVSDWQGGKKFYRENRIPALRPENTLAECSKSLEDYLRLLLLRPLPLRHRFYLQKKIPDAIYTLLAWLYGRARLINANRHLTSDIDVVLRTEHIEADFRKLLEKLGAPVELKLPMINKTESITQDVDSYHTPLTRKWLQHMYRDLIDRFYATETAK